MDNDPMTDAGEKLSSIMAMLDMVKTGKAAAKRIEHIKFEDVSRTTWGEVVLQMQLLQLLCDSLEQMAPAAAKVVTNEALQAHLNAVMTSD
jgi:hypothetical protein